MKDHVYKLIELTGTSIHSMEDAVNTALHRASNNVRNFRWFQVTEIRGEIDVNKVARWQITLKAGFTVED